MAPDDILATYRKVGGRVETRGKVTLTSKEDFALFYTPGVGKVSMHLAEHPEDARELSIKGNSVAVVSDGTAVLGLGNIGPYGALPVMEGKALIFKQLANIDAWPLVLDTKDPEEIIRIVKAIAPNFGGINLEDIAAPQCFEIERRLIEELDIPVMHDDQHGTAIVTLAGLINAATVTGRDLNTSRVVVNGVGAAGSAIMRLLKRYAPGMSLLAVDTKGIISSGIEGLNAEKRSLIDDGIILGEESGDLTKALTGADIFIGVSKGNILSGEMVKKMNADPIIFAMANPVPEIMPEEAKAAGAAVMATGRSDFPNQINNALVFPGVFRGALDGKVRKITEDMKLNAAKAIAALVETPSAECIIPDILDERVVAAVANAIQS
ncbi:MAG: NADP-dependent malic enzyme [Candidatus Pacebacteria bacterium]|nr:NADP-dependent malic enzyme [Candidatus Paceibacterota bacterium]